MFDAIKKCNIITIDGYDGTGKSLITSMLQKRIPNSMMVSFPNYDSFPGHYIKQVLIKKLPFPGEMCFQAVMLADKITTLNDIEALYEIPQTLIFCRYLESSYAYRHELPLQYVVNINSVLPQSDYVFVLHGKNYGKNSDYYETDEKQKIISERYLILAKKFGWKLIDNNKTPDAIVDEIIHWLDLYNGTGSFDKTLRTYKR